MDIYKVDNLNFYGIQLNDQEIITLDLAHLEEELETEIYGLIGFDLLEAYDVLFDYENKRMTLIKPSYFETFKDKTFPDSQFTCIPFSMESHIPVIDVAIGDKRLKCGIDSGAESNLLDDDLFSSMKKHLGNLETDTLTGADNHPKDVQTGDISELRIGDQAFGNVRTIFSDIAHLNDGYKLNLDGLVGYDVLSAQKTLLSFQRKEMVFIAEPAVSH